MKVLQSTPILYSTTRPHASMDISSLELLLWVYSPQPLDLILSWRIIMWRKLKRWGYSLNPSFIISRCAVYHKATEAPLEMETETHLTEWQNALSSLFKYMITAYKNSFFFIYVSIITVYS